MYEKYQYYYLIPVNKKFKKSLKKVISDKKLIKKYKNSSFDYNPEEIIHRFLNNKHVYKHKYIFICLYEYKNWGVKYIEWAWNPYKTKLKDITFESKNAIFKGCINVEEYELAADIYNL